MDNQKKIMILGGGYYQLPLIKKSVELGYYTIVCGIKGDYPGYKYASKWYDVDTFNKEACLEIARLENIDGIITAGTDQVLPTLGFIVDNMSLYGPSYKSTILSTNKAEMKETFKSTGVRTAYFEKVTSITDCIDFSNKYGFPIVLKVVDASGSKGVSIIENLEELKEQYEIIKSLTSKNYLIIEEFIKGEEFGAQAYVADNKLTFVMPHGDLTYKADTNIPIGHYAPYERTEELLSDITEQLQKSISALQINNTAINADFILKDGKVYVIEIGARAGATCLPELVSCHYDINYYEYLIHNCLGINKEVRFNTKNACWVETLISTKEGIIKSIDYPLNLDNIVDIKLYPMIGNKVNVFRTAYDRIGTFVVKAHSMSEVIHSRNELISSIKIDVN